MPVQTTSQTDAPHRGTCGQCGATIAIDPGTEACFCPQCGTRHLARIIDSPRYQAVLTQPLLDEIDEAAARGILRECELEARTGMLAIEQNVLAAEQVLRQAERAAAALQQPGRQFWDALALMIAVGVITVVNVAGGAVMSCLTLPVLLVLLVRSWRVWQQLTVEEQQRRSALDQLMAQHRVELERIEAETVRLEARLTAGPRSMR